MIVNEKDLASCVPSIRLMLTSAKAGAMWLGRVMWFKGGLIHGPPEWLFPEWPRPNWSTLQELDSTRGRQTAKHRVAPLGAVTGPA